MNRIILIGNSFDLAHGLKTSYKNFIDDYWQKAMNNIETRGNSDRTIETQIKSIYEPKKEFYYEDENILFSAVSHENIENFHNPVVFRDNTEYKNYFLKVITEKSYSNWVDIEEEYFTQLKNTINNLSIRRSKGHTARYSIEELNSDFDNIKRALEKYLIEEINNFESKKFYLENIMQNFNIADFSFYGISALRKEYTPKTEVERMKYDRQFATYSSRIEERRDIYNLYETQIYPKQTLLLNFNYTDLPERLKQCIRDNEWKLDDWAKNSFEDIYIHGKLNDGDYPIIFGYGDERDEIHKEIEKRGGRYLDNIKTINYLKTQTYKSMLKFIESGLYQIFIWGHSCGLSDKTLLNTLFEHENCVSIKPFYYTDGKGYNNYDDIVKNIYRCFTDKALMREKVVNKRFCVKLL
jgi:hypothetical protein